MRRSGTALRGLLGFAAIAALAVVPTRAQVPPPTQQPTYRSAVVLVPVDVRVMDTKSGMPVTDLKAEDFSVFEDDVRQEIRHFAPQSFGPLPSGNVPRAPRPVSEAAQPLFPPSIVSQTRRVFLIVLGRGRLASGPAKALDAAARFVRTGLQPPDQVAVFGYDRATDFTTAHEQAARVIDRFKNETDAIAGALAQQQGGLAAVYGSRELPASVQERIDRVFAGTGSLPYSPVGSAATNRRADGTKQDSRVLTEHTIDGVVAAGRITPAEEGGRIAPADSPGAEWSAFDAFASSNMQTLDDTKNLYAAIAYMQRIEGEKHLVFMTSDGINLRRLEDYQAISAMAADARVAIDVVWSGFGHPLQMKAMRGLSEDTGGVSSVAEYGQAAFDRVDLATRTGYLLGYYPSNLRRTGEYRRIQVVVNRPGVTVLYRRGYQASDEMRSFNRRAYLTQFRLEAAARHRDEVKDIPIRMHAAIAVAKGQSTLTVDAVIDASRLTFNLEKNLYAGRLDIAVVAMDERRQILAGDNRTLTPTITEDHLARIRKDGLACTVTTQVPANTRYVRFIVYDYEADLVGSAGASVF